MKNISKLAKIHDYVTIIGDCEIGDGTEILPFTVIEKSIIGKNAKVGPNAHLREGTVLGDNTRIGNFVEIKKSTIGRGTKIAHLTYVGDAEIGESCNLGCGVVFCNYDGKTKHKTQVGNNVFIGSNVNLIAPLEIGDNCFIAAGTTVTKNLPENTFVIARPEQKIKPNKFKK